MDDNNKKDNFLCPYINSESYDSPYFHREDINLMDVCSVIWKRRIFVLVVTIVTIAIVSGYAFFAPKIYEAKASIQPSLDFKMNVLLAETALFPTEDLEAQSQSSTEKIFFGVLNQMNVGIVQEKFWNDKDMGSHLSQSKKKLPSNISEHWFVKNLAVSKPYKKKGLTHAEITLSGSDPETITQILKGYISYTLDHSSRIFLEIAKEKLVGKKKDIENQIDVLRTTYHEETRQRLNELHKYKAIAEKLGMVDMPESMADKPEYAKGVKALEAEIEHIKNQGNDDLWIKGLPLLLGQLKVIETIDFKDIEFFPLQASSISYYQKYITPKQQVLIAVIGCLAGLILGSLCAVFLEFSLKLKQKNS